MELVVVVVVSFVTGEREKTGRPGPAPRRAPKVRTCGGAQSPTWRPFTKELLLDKTAGAF